MSEEKYESYLIDAIILVKTKLGQVWNVANEAKKIEGVQFAKAVAGRYDVVVHAKTDRLSYVIARIHEINGIESTETQIALEDRLGR
jgi:hypothetical protein